MCRLIAIMIIALLVGCAGDREHYYSEMPEDNSPAPVAPVETTSVSDRISELTQADERTKWVDFRDPFTAPRPQLESFSGAASTGPRPDCDINTEPLGWTDVNSMRLMGLVTGTAVPRAMVIAGGSQAVMVTEGALVGPECSYRVVDIRDNEMLLEELTMDASDRNSRTLTLNTERLNSRFIEIVDE